MWENPKLECVENPIDPLHANLVFLFGHPLHFRAIASTKQGSTSAPTKGYRKALGRAHHNRKHWLRLRIQPRNRISVGRHQVGFLAGITAALLLDCQESGTQIIHGDWRIAGRARCHRWRCHVRLDDLCIRRQSLAIQAGLLSHAAGCRRLCTLSN